MTSAGTRRYSYNPQAYSALLLKVHNKVQADLERNTLASQALEIQTILQEIKQVAKKLENSATDPIEQELVNQYKDFINEIISIENTARVNNAGGKKTNRLSAPLFRKANKTNTIQGADNILEEEMAALMAALERNFGGTGNIYDFLGGSQGADVAAMQNLTEDLKRKIIDSVQETADKIGAKYQAKDLLKGRSQKVDNKGLTISLKVGLDIDNNKLNKLAYYLKDATFTDKQYTR